MNFVWTWGGTFFGYMEGENLWTSAGKHIGKVRRGTVFGADGHYLGELRSGNRLIRQVGEQTQSIPPYTPYTTRTPSTQYANAASHPMPPGYEDFPPPESFGEK
jgi:hypothetical protein